MTFRSDAVIGNRERVMHYLTPMREEFSLHVDLKSHKFPAALVMLIERTWDTWVNKNSTVEASIAQLQRALFVLSQRTPCRPDCCAARLHTGEKGGGAEGLYDRHRQGPTVMAQGLYVDGRCGQTKPMQTLRDGWPGKAEAPPAMRCRSGASSRPILAWAWGCALKIISGGCTLINRTEDEMCGPPFIGWREILVGRWDDACGLGQCVVCFRSGRGNNFRLDGWRWVDC